jgi:hypothetical protein
VRLIASSVLERSPMCARSQAVHSSAALCALDLRQCDRVHVIALKTQGTAGEVMAARATWALRADETYARSRPLGSSALVGARSSLFALFYPFNLSLNARTCNTIEY